MSKMKSLEFYDPEVEMVVRSSFVQEDPAMMVVDLDALRDKDRKAQPFCQHCGMERPLDPQLDHICSKKVLDFGRSIRQLADKLREAFCE